MDEGLAGGGTSCNQAVVIQATGSLAMQNGWICSDLDSSGTAGTFTAGTDLLISAQYNSGRQRSIYMSGVNVGTDNPGTRSSGLTQNFIGYGYSSNGYATMKGN